MKNTLINILGAVGFVVGVWILSFAISWILKNIDMSIICAGGASIIGFIFFYYIIEDFRKSND